MLTVGIFVWIPGGQVCYECNSKLDNCTYNSVDGARRGACARGYDVCSVYKRVPADGSAQLVRHCDDMPCSQFNISWKTGNTKHCRLCCKEELCNNFTVDPCDPSEAGHLACNAPLIALFGFVHAAFLGCLL